MMIPREIRALLILGVVSGLSSSGWTQISAASLQVSRPSITRIDHQQFDPMGNPVQPRGYRFTGGAGVTVTEKGEVHLDSRVFLGPLTDAYFVVEIMVYPASDNPYERLPGLPGGVRGPAVHTRQSPTMDLALARNNGGTFLVTYTTPRLPKGKYKAWMTLYEGDEPSVLSGNLRMVTTHSFPCDVK